MEIRCQKCGYMEETKLDWVVALIGVAMPLGGFWAWTTYFFAGTGFAKQIVIALIAGGAGILLFKKKLVEWIIMRRHTCSDLEAIDWDS